MKIITEKDGYMIVKLFDENNELFCSICGFDSWVSNVLFYEHDICLLK
jgi:hypothetical protein